MKCLLLVAAIAASWIRLNEATPVFLQWRPVDSSVREYDQELTVESSNDVPMVYSNNFEMIMPDYYDHLPAASMQYQNFEAFYDPQMPGNKELSMMESQLKFLESTPVRAPQPLSDDERHVRQALEEVDIQKDRRGQWKLNKGSTEPRGREAPLWDQFDYDDHSDSHAKDY